MGLQASCLATLLVKLSISLNKDKITMVNSSNQGPVHFSWQDILWRLALTALLLLVLAASGITISSSITNHPDTQVLPTLTYEAK